MDGLLDEHGALFEYPGHVSGVRSVFCDRAWRGSLVAIDKRVRSHLIAPLRFGAPTPSNCLYPRQTKRPFYNIQDHLEALDETRKTAFRERRGLSSYIVVVDG